MRFEALFSALVAVALASSAPTAAAASPGDHSHSHSHSHSHAHAPVTLSAASSASAEHATQAMFTDFISAHRKTYPTQHVFKRYNAYKHNLALIHAHNAQAKEKAKARSLLLGSSSSTHSPHGARSAGLGLGLGASSNSGNANANSGSSVFTLKMNEFGDMTHEEFKARLGLRPSTVRLHRARRLAAEADARPRHSAGAGAGSSSTTTGAFAGGLGRRVAGSVHDADDLNKHKDWRAEGKVGPVKNQGQCGSCWAFSALAALETAAAIASDSAPPVLSEQQLVSCAHTTGNHGCRGGFMENAFEYLISAGGSCSEADYPYTSGLLPPDSSETPASETEYTGPSERDGVCKPCGAAVKPTSYASVPENDEAALMRAVDRGVVTVAIHAGNPKFQFAGDGVFDDADCGDELDHGVAIVGYGTEDGVPYWLVRNSWSAAWAQGGYVKMKRGVGAKGICGIAMMPTTVEV